MSQNEKHITIVVQNGALYAIEPNRIPLKDGMYDILDAKALSNDWHLSDLPAIPNGLTSHVKFTTNLSNPDAFSEAVGFVCSLRTSGHILIYEPNQISVLTVTAGAVVGFSQLHRAKNATIDQRDEVSLKQFVHRLVTPIVGLLSWCAPGPLSQAAHMSVPLEHLLLDTLRKSDEDLHQQDTLLHGLPDSARLVPDLAASLDQRLLSELRRTLGMPPYLISHLKQMKLSHIVMGHLNDAIQTEVLVVERHHEVTTPPHLSARFDVDRVELQNLVARFNHIFRRLTHISGWTSSELTQQLVVFGQFYGYQSVFDGVTQRADGALNPLPLIENAINTHQSNVQRVRILAEALQELVFFELSSAHTIDAKERRALMSMTTQLVASCLNSKRDNVA